MGAGIGCWYWVLVLGAVLGCCSAWLLCVLFGRAVVRAIAHGHVRVSGLYVCVLLCVRACVLSCVRAYVWCARAFSFVYYTCHCTTVCMVCACVLLWVHAHVCACCCTSMRVVSACCCACVHSLVCCTGCCMCMRMVRTCCCLRMHVSGACGYCSMVQRVLCVFHLCDARTLLCGRA